jgi:RNA polymerase sigma-70 factor (ECF subfamily)
VLLHREADLVLRPFGEVVLLRRGRHRRGWMRLPVSTVRGRPLTVGTHPDRPAADAEQLWEGFSQDLHRYIARRVRRPQDAEDILQTVFLRIQANAPTLRDDERLLGWIYTVARNAITDHYRLASNRRELPVDDFLGPLEQMQDDGDDEQGPEAELATCLQPMLAQLPPDQAAALELVELRGVSQVEAARLAGVSVSGMKSRVQRGRARLRELLLTCCSVSRDVRGRVQEFEPRAPDCSCGAR